MHTRLRFQRPIEIPSRDGAVGPRHDAVTTAPLVEPLDRFVPDVGRRRTRAQPGAVEIEWLLTQLIDVCLSLSARLDALETRQDHAATTGCSQPIGSARRSDNIR